ncbi:MAG TPA: response regulator [Methylomirabilota bacterium]|jgi:CheY-like chemotaxis protein|nr:response regulator [Methylomirabilota bacterium]
MTEPAPARRAPIRDAPPIDLAPVVLIADDERILLELYREALEDEGFRVLTAANGREALALAETCIPDVLVTDVAMPRLDGFGLVRALRCLYPSVPVIVATGDYDYDGHPVEQVAVGYGAAATLNKPFDLDRLCQAVRSVVPHLGPVTRESLRESLVEGGRAA